MTQTFCKNDIEDEDKIKFSTVIGSERELQIEDLAEPRDDSHPPPKRKHFLCSTSLET